MSSEKETNESDICLVRMPYLPIETPSPALGLLKAALHGTGIRASVIYADLLFAGEIGFNSYQMLGFGPRADMLGEWTFAGAAFPDFQTDNSHALRHGAEIFCRKFGGGGNQENIEAVMDVVREVRAYAPGFIDRLSHEILKKRPKIVGCSSTYRQHIASLALLRRIRELDPRVVTLIGGANCEVGMGAATVREFPWVDMVFSGEADDEFYPLCRELLEFGREVPTCRLPYGAINRELAFSLKGDKLPRAVVRDMDRIPFPDYDDYFRTLNRVFPDKMVIPGLLLESSRGCWWGQCAFCGLNGYGMCYRSKSPERTISEFHRLTDRHRVFSISVTDNNVNPKYFQSVFPELASGDPAYNIYWMMRPDLSRDQVRLLSRAGVRWFQPGIEGLHDDLLDLMKKGIDTIANVQVLKYAREFGIQARWQFLIGLPGEDDDWYREMVSWLPLIFHLQTPGDIKFVRYDRFSDYQREPERYGLKLVPYRAYENIYPVSPEARRELAYYFMDEKNEAGGEVREITPGLQVLFDCWKQWRAAYAGPYYPMLGMTDEGDRIRIIDTRPVAPVRNSILDGLSALIYRICDPAVRREDLPDRLNGLSGKVYPEDDVFAAVEELKVKKLILDIRGKLLSLAVPGPIPVTANRKTYPGGWSPLPSFRGLMREREERGEKISLSTLI